MIYTESQDYLVAPELPSDNVLVKSQNHRREVLLNHSNVTLYSFPLTSPIYPYDGPHEPLRHYMCPVALVGVTVPPPFSRLCDL